MATQDELIIAIRNRQDKYNALLESGQYPEAKKLLGEVCRMQLELVQMTRGAELKQRRFEEARRLKGIYDNFDAKYAEKKKAPADGVKDDKRGEKTDEPDDNGENADGESKGAPDILTQLPHEDVTFDSVVGLDEAKSAIKRSLRRVKYDKVFKKLNGNPNFGILLYGEPGTGKTMFAKAVATELDIPFFNLNVSDIKDKYVGESEKNVKRAFSQLRKYDAVVLYCDEAEALFGARGSGEGAKLDNSILTELIKEIDGFQKNNTHIIIIAATNHPEAIDRAAYSRFVIKTRVGLPTYEARLQILKNNIRTLGDDITFEEIAELTERYSGRDLNKLALNCFDTAFEDYLNDHPETENDENVADLVPVTRAHILSGLKQIRPDTTRAQIEFYDRYEKQFRDGGEKDEEPEEKPEKPEKNGDKGVKKGTPDKDGGENDGNGGFNFDGGESENYKAFVPDGLVDYENTLDEEKWEQWLKDTSFAIEDKLSEFGIKVKVERVIRSASYSRFALSLERGTAVNDVVRRADDVSLALNGARIRFNTEVQGSPFLELEVPNPTRDIVGLKEIWIQAEKFKEDGEIIFPIGKGGDGQTVVLKESQTSHLLVAGSTGSGKSVMLNSLICYLAGNYSPAELSLMLIDPKQVEFFTYEKLPQLCGNILTEMDEIRAAMKSLCAEMDERYALLKRAGVRKLKEYNEKSGKKLPYIVVVIDEYADITVQDKGKQVETSLVRLVQKGRAAGIHIVLATQRVSVDVISGTIKNNFPVRIAFSVPSYRDSMTILDESGAQNLSGKGDLLMKSDFGLQRLQSPFITAQEILDVTNFIVNNAKG